MNSKITTQILCSSFVLLLMIADSLQSPISEDKRAAAHKLMRFGRNPHQLMHFGKRALDSNMNSNENDANEPMNPISRDEIIQRVLEDFASRNDFDNLRADPLYVNNMDRRSEAIVSPFAMPRKFYLKKADNRDNVFMHFG